MAKIGVEIGVVHLVRAQNGIEPFYRFLDSYVSCPANISHNLLIIYKGFDTPEALNAFNTTLETRLAGYTEQTRAERTLQVSDAGLDITAYLKAAHHFHYKYFCFLNSYSVLLAEGWLAKIMACMNQAGIGMVGATSSCESRYTHLQQFIMQTDLSVAQKLRMYVRLGLMARIYEPFPNCHLRTNAFMTRRETLLRVKSGRLESKLDVLRFESGRRGLTRQIERMGMGVRIVGRNGISYPLADGCSSRTFRSGGQSNLLVADNQTEMYLNADDAVKQQLAEQAWGALKAKEIGC